MQHESGIIDIEYTTNEQCIQVHKVLDVVKSLSTNIMLSLPDEDYEVPRVTFFANDDVVNNAQYIEQVEHAIAMGAVLHVDDT